MALYSAIRRTRTLRVFSVLTPAQLDVRTKAQKYAAQHSMRVVERGTQFGLCSLHEATPAHMPMLTLNSNPKALKSELDCLKQACQARNTPVLVRP